MIFFSSSVYAVDKLSAPCIKLIKDKAFYDAIETCESIAKKSDKTAQFALGTLYYNGQGVLQDYTIANKWILKAAKNNLAVAQYNIGIMMANGQGIDTDLVQAVAWLKVALKNNYSAAGDVIVQINKELSAKEKSKVETLYKKIQQELK